MQALRVPSRCFQIYRQSAHKGGKVVSPTHRSSLPPGNIPGTQSFKGRVDPSATVRHSTSMKNSSDTIGNRNQNTVSLRMERFVHLASNTRITNLKHNISEAGPTKFCLPQTSKCVCYPSNTRTSVRHDGRLLRDGCCTLEEKQARWESKLKGIRPPGIRRRVLW